MRLFRYNFKAEIGIDGEDFRQSDNVSPSSHDETDIAEIGNNPVDNHDDSYPTKLVNVSGSGSKQTSLSKRRRIIWIVAGSLAMVVVAIGGLIASKEKSNQSFSSSSTFCQPASIKDTKNSILDLTLFDGLDQLVNDVEAQNLERAVMDGYNNTSGGCTDEFERWIYGTKLISQSVEPLYYLDRHANGTLTTTFAEAYTRVMRFQTIISCDGCSNDEAFAFEYPKLFGAISKLGVRRGLCFDQDQNCCTTECTVVDGTRYCQDVCIPCTGEEEGENPLPECCVEVNCV